MKLLVFSNLASGIPDGSSLDFVRSFAEANDEVTIRFADPSSNFEELLKDATEYDAVVASGGDGTVASILYMLKNTGVPILPFPAGTANLLTQNLYSPTEAPALAKMIRDGRQLDCDLGEITVGGKTMGFTIMAGCGYDAKIMQDAAPNKKILGHLAYFTSAFANPLPQVAKFKMIIDGEHIECEGICALIINFSKITMDLSLSPNSSPCDGMLDVLVLASDSALALLPTFIGATLDQSGKVQSNSNLMRFYRGKDIYIESDPPLPVQYDGEPLKENCPIHARVLPGAARLIMVDEAYEEFTSK